MCLRCTKTLINPEDLTISCPLDKKKTQFQLSQKGDIALPLNRPLMAIGEAVTLHLKFCEVCQSHAAEFLCSYDLLRLCGPCARRHRSSKHLRSHVVQSIGTQTVCTEHQRKVMWMCFTEVKLLCCECGEFGDRHQLCTVLPLAGARARLLRTLKKVEERSTRLLTQVSSLSEHPELPATLQRQSSQLRSLTQAVNSGPKAWVQALQVTIEIARCQKDAVATVKQLLKERSV